MHQLQEQVRLHRMGVGARQVARILGMGPNTERSYRTALQAEELLLGPPDALPALEALRAAMARHRPRAHIPAHEQSSIEAWRPRIEELVTKGLTARPIYDRIRQKDETFDGSYWAVKRLCRRILATGACVRRTSRFLSRRCLATSRRSISDMPES